MIFPLAGLAIGALVGLILARRQGGKSLDLAQWSAVFALIGGVIGLFVLIFVDRANFVPTDPDAPASEAPAETPADAPSEATTEAD